VLGALHGAHALLVALNLLAPRLRVASGGLAQAWSIILLNAMNLAVACRRAASLPCFLALSCLMWTPQGLSVPIALDTLGGDGQALPNF
jgi:hypothetical protein